MFDLKKVRRERFYFKIVIYFHFYFKVLIMQVMPAALDIIGAVAVFVSALAITFEKQVYRLFCSRCRCRRQGTTE